MSLKDKLAAINTAREKVTDAADSLKSVPKFTI